MSGHRFARGRETTTEADSLREAALLAAHVRPDLVERCGSLEAFIAFWCWQPYGDADHDDKDATWRQR